MPSISAGSSPPRCKAGAGLRCSTATTIERRPASARAAEVSLQNYRRLVSAAQRAEINAPTPEGEAARRAIGDAAGRGEREVLASGRRASRLHLSSVADRGAGRHAACRPTTLRLPCRPRFPARARRMSGLSRTLDARPVRRRLRAARIRRPADRGDRARRGEAAACRSRCIASTIADAAALYGSALVLVRPDGHVAWRGDRAPDDALAMIDTVRGAGPRIAARRASAAAGAAATSSAARPPGP